MKNLLKLLFFLSLATLSFGQNSLFYSGILTATGTQPARFVAPTGITVHKISWVPIGTVTTCQIGVDSSSDGVTFSANGTIAAQTCTSAGQLTSSALITGYVRLNLSTFTGGGSLMVTYSGYINAAGSAVTATITSGPTGASALQVQGNGTLAAAIVGAPVLIGNADNSGNLRSANCVFTTTCIPIMGRSIAVGDGTGAVGQFEADNNSVFIPAVVNYATNGTTYDRVRTASATDNGTTTGGLTGEQLIEKGPRWGAFSVPAAGVVATASQAAGAAGVRHVVDCISYTASAIAAPAATVITLNLRDGATGAGTIIWSKTLGIPATTGVHADQNFCGLNLIGTAATAMTLEYSALLANEVEAVAITGFDVK